jgi:hypothetical protein
LEITSSSAWRETETKIEIRQDHKENSAHVLLKRNKNQSGARTMIQILTTGRAK